jgi:hypothetical protein
MNKLKTCFIGCLRNYKNMQDNQTIGPTSFSFQGINWGKVGAGALVAVAGAILTYVSAWLTGQDFGASTPIVMAVWTTVANIVRKWVSNLE